MLTMNESVLITFLDPGEEWEFEADSITSNDEVDYVEMVTDSSVYQSS